MPSVRELLVKDLSCQVHLGCTEAERSQKQEVRFHLKLNFREDLMACRTDQLADAICYAELSQKVSAVCESKGFATVEHLAYEVYQSLKEGLPRQVAILVEAHKVHPPVPGLLGGVHFRFGEIP